MGHHRSGGSFLPLLLLLLLLLALKLDTSVGGTQIASPERGRFSSKTRALKWAPIPATRSPSVPSVALCARARNVLRPVFTFCCSSPGACTYASRSAGSSRASERNLPINHNCCCCCCFLLVSASAEREQERERERERGNFSASQPASQPASRANKLRARPIMQFYCAHFRAHYRLASASGSRFSTPELCCSWAKTFWKILEPQEKSNQVAGGHFHFLVGEKERASWRGHSVCACSFCLRSA